MNAIDHLKKQGITPRLKPDGKVGLQGMGALPEPMKNEIITWAKNNREKILKELAGVQKGQKAQKELEPGPLKIEAMTTCLDGKPCPHLDGPGEIRPICSKTGEPVFDMTACPLHRWAETQKTINERVKK